MPIGSLSGPPRNPSKYAVLVTAHLETSKRKHSHHIYFSTIFLNSERRKKPGSPNSELLLLKTAADEIYFKQSRTHKHGKTRSELGLRGTWAQSSRECRDPGRGLHGAPSAARGCRDGRSPLSAKLHPDPGLFRRCSHRKGAPPDDPPSLPPAFVQGRALEVLNNLLGSGFKATQRTQSPPSGALVHAPQGNGALFPAKPTESRFIRIQRPSNSIWTRGGPTSCAKGPTDSPWGSGGRAASAGSPQPSPGGRKAAWAVCQVTGRTGCQ